MKILFSKEVYEVLRRRVHIWGFIFSASVLLKEVLSYSKQNNESSKMFMSKFPKPMNMFPSMARKDFADVVRNFEIILDYLGEPERILLSKRGQ